LTEPTLKIGVVGVRDGWSSRLLADAIAERTGYRLLVDMDDVVLDLNRGVVLYEDVDLRTLDGLVIKKVGERYSPDMLDRLEMLRFVEDAGVRVFSSPTKILRLIDRLSCTVTLRAAGIPIPPTVVTEHLPAAADAVRRFGQAVLKPLYSTKARGMLVLDGAAGDLEDRLRQFRDAGNPVLYIQQKLDMRGRDFGAAFLGGRYLGTYARVSARGSWNTTIHSGGHYEAHALEPAVVDLASKAQAAFGLDFTTVDIAETAEGPSIFEVSAFGGFRGMSDGLDIDAASLYADYVVGKLRDA